jgi:hypothetical protein
MRARNKLNVKQVASLKDPGIYSDGGGLYIRVRKCGSRSWVFIYQMNHVRREMGLGSDLDVTLAKAREKAAAARQLVLDGVDPQKQRAAAKAYVPAPVTTLGNFASELIETIEEGFRNHKHRQQWKSLKGASCGYHGRELGTTPARAQEGPPRHVCDGQQDRPGRLGCTVTRRGRSLAQRNLQIIAAHVRGRVEL